MNYVNVINQIMVLFFTIIVGFIARKKGIISEEMSNGLTDILVNITLPFMLVSSFNYDNSMDMLRTSGIIFVISLLVHISLFIISKFLYHKYPASIKNVLRFITIFSNSGFMGYPVAESVYGKLGIFYSAIYNIPINIMVWTIGIMLFTGERDLKSIKKAILNPGIIAIFVGLILYVFSIRLPVPVFKTFETIGSMTTPLSMILIGTMLANMKLKDMISGFSLYYSAAARLIAAPLAVLFILKALGLSGMMLGIPVLITAMPGAANAVIFSNKFGGDSKFASKCVFFTTLLSSFTIPLIIFFINLK